MVSCSTQKAGLGFELDLLCWRNKWAWHRLCKDRDLTDAADNEGKPGGLKAKENGYGYTGVFLHWHSIPKYVSLSSFWCLISRAVQQFAPATPFWLGSCLSGVSLILLPLGSSGLPLGSPTHLIPVISQFFSTIINPADPCGWHLHLKSGG